VKVRARLLLFGAFLPVLGMLVAVLVAGQIFHFSLLTGVDKSLAQLAAVESVTLFDGPDGRPHLPPTHPGPNAHELPHLEGVVVVYGTDGRPFIQVPANVAVPERVPDATPGSPRSTRAFGGVTTRELLIVVSSRDGQRFPLWVARPLRDLEETIAAFYKVSLSVCAGVAMLLLLVQVWQARRLSARIAVMSKHLPRLREGDFDALLPTDSTGDELADLRNALEEATHQLKAARGRQERLIANAAHEIQTPLACMRTTVDLALFRDRTLEETRQALHEARTEIDRLATLARELLDLAAAGQVSIDREDVDLLHQVRVALEAFRGQAEKKGINLRVDAKAPVLVRGSSAGLRQAIDNLVGNAIKFSPASATVEVIVSANPARGRATVLVSDEGIGVSDNEREKIFEPFYRTRSEGGGTGLGLAIARDIARQHGGDVGLMSSSVGARFALELPLATSAS
jgi:signal transduction histidine kinase